jgi:hypothetical protein
MGRLTGSRNMPRAAGGPGNGFGETDEQLRVSKIRQDRLPGDSVVDPHSIRKLPPDSRRPKQPTDGCRDD